MDIHLYIYTQMEERMIKIKFGSKTVNVKVESNKIKKSLLKEYFSGNGKLTGLSNGESCLLRSDEEYYLLEANISLYEMTVFESMYKLKNELFMYFILINYKSILLTDNDVVDSTKLKPRLGENKKKVFNEMRQKLYEDAPSTADHKRKVIIAKSQLRVQYATDFLIYYLFQFSDRKLMNKRQKTQHAEIEEKLYVERLVHIFWRHANSINSKYMKMGQTIGLMNYIYLNKNEEYSFQQVKSILLKEYVDDNNDFYFKTSNVQLGNENEKMFAAFLNSKNEEINF